MLSQVVPTGPVARSWVTSAAAVLLFMSCGLACVAASGSDALCHSSGRRPLTPYGLELCYMHSHRGCCLSGFDTQYIVPAYEAVLPPGAGCGAGSQRAYASMYALRRFLCLPCDPSEPLYRLRSVDGDIAKGGIVPPSTNSQPSEFTWRVCRSFLYGKPGSVRGLWGDDGSRYDECGVVLQTCPATPLFNVDSGQFSFPPTTCPTGTELVLPSVTLAESTDPGVELLLRVAQTMPDFQMVIVDDSDPAFDPAKTPCFGQSDGTHCAAYGGAVVWALVAAVLAALAL